MFDRIDAFILKPDQECSEEERRQGVGRVVALLQSDPGKILQSFRGDPYLPSVDVLDDLAEKMRKLNCRDQLELLFDACPDELISDCVYNLHDLHKCLDALPGRKKELLTRITSKPEIADRVTKSGPDPMKKLVCLETLLSNVTLKIP